MNYFCGEKNSQMRRPEMEVIRFTESDIVVASNGGRRATTPSLTLTGFNGKKPADGVANLNGVDYSISSLDDVNTFLGALMSTFNTGVRCETPAAVFALRICEVTSDI